MYFLLGRKKGKIRVSRGTLVGWEEERKNSGEGALYWVGLGCLWFRVFERKENQDERKGRKKNML